MKKLLLAILIFAPLALAGCESDCQEAARLYCEHNPYEGRTKEGIEREKYWGPGGCYANRLWVCASGQQL